MVLQLILGIVIGKLGFCSALEDFANSQLLISAKAFFRFARGVGLFPFNRRFLAVWRKPQIGSGVLPSQYFSPSPPLSLCGLSSVGGADYGFVKEKKLLLQISSLSALQTRSQPFLRHSERVETSVNLSKEFPIILPYAQANYFSQIICHVY